MKHNSCDHIGLFTQNMGVLKTFYTDILGFEIKSDSTLPRSVVEPIFGLADDCRLMKLEKDGFMIEIFQPLSATLEERTNRSVGINHWGYRVDDRAAFVTRMRGNGQRIVEIDRNGHSVYFLIDPDGNRIEIRNDAE
jgi:catechol 2,3-dioxygenase-like lactoylglutathione lyase family enzyme